METWKPFGQFPVGVVDLEYQENSVSVGPSPSDVDPKQHLTGRIYYPCTPKREWWWFRRKSPSISWLPSVHYAYGLSNFLFFRRPKGFLYWIAKQVIFFLAYVFGSLQRLEFHSNAPLARLPARLPVVVFSHGLGGHRSVYSITCSELASQGYVVLAVEHADGSSSCTKLAGSRGWKFYKGLGGDEGQVEKTRHRVEEMKTAAEVLRGLHEGASYLPGLALAGGRLPTSFFEGCLDLRCLASVGHSYGGATTAALVAEDPSFKCGVCLDPWWAALPPEAVCMQRWKTRAPLLVMGSHDWNVPNVQGEVLCGPDRQAKVLNAAKNGGTAGGSMLLIITGSSHNTFADPLALFSEHVGWALRALGLTARLDPVLGVHLVNAAVLNFLSLHLPLTGDQRQLQTWSPSSGHNALDRIAQLDSFTAPQSGRGLLAWLFPGRGLLNAVSDALLNRVLKTGKHGGAKEAPDDVVTGDEVLESTMPSREPAGGAHPHAPGAPFKIGGISGATATGEVRFDARQRQALRSQVGGSYADGVRQDHVDQFVALLGEKHVWKCEVHV